MTIRTLRLWPGIALAVLLTGCGAPQKIDYTAFKTSRPRSILVLPPVNESPDVKATYGLYSYVAKPLAESGYYVFPVALVDETFKQNGLSSAGDIATIPVAKLREIFGADAAMYVTVTRYGTTYAVLDSVTVVAATARLVDLRTGTTLWAGSASASDNEGGSMSGGGLVGMLVVAAAKQIINSATDAADSVAPVTATRLLSAETPGGVLYGPRSPKYGVN